MLNVNKITSMLAKLPDQQLQQYAQMHKSDPYIMALAMSESSRRKEMRASGQAAQGAPEQPKVVDQAVAEMAPQRMPEDMGIARIPSGDMNFAGGGIVAFADGGDVERFNGTQSQFVQDLAGIPGMYDKWWQANREEDRIKAEREREMAERQQAEMAARQKTSFANYLFGSPKREAEGKAELAQLATSAQAPKATPTYSPDDYSGMDRRIMSGSQQPSIPSITPPAVKAAPKVDAGPVRAPAAQSAGIGGLDVAGMTRKALDAAAKQPNPFAADVETIGKEKVAAKEAELTGLEAIQKQFSDIYKGRKERLDKREGDIEKMKDQGLGLALLQAGAAMMTTRGGLGMAIGKGVDTGSRQYAAGIDKVRSAQEKLSDARDRLEEVEAQRGEMSARELNKARSEIKTAGIGAREDLLKANMQMYGVNRETALKMVDNQVKVGIAQLEQAGANARAAAANRNPQLELIQAIQKDPSLAATYQAMHGTKNDLMSQYTDYLGKNPTGSIEDFLKTKALFSTLSNVRTGAPVSTLPAGAQVLR